jgi:HK97 family phage major capsid protein
MSDSVLKRVFEARRNAQEELRALYTDAEGRALSAEETQKEERLATEIADLQKRERNLIDMEESRKVADEARAASPVEQIRAEAPDADAEARAAFAAVLRGEQRAFEFRAPIATPNIKGTAAHGGDLVPTTLYSQIWEHMVEESAILQAGPTILRTTSGENLVVPKTTNYSAAALVGENSTIGKSNPTVDKVTLGAYKLAFIVQMSSELVQDAAFDVVGFGLRQGGRALGRGANTYFVTGTGSTQPEGIWNAADSGVVVAHNAAAITAENLIDLMHKVSPSARPGSVWMFNDTTIAVVRKIREGSSDGNFLWQPGLQAGQPDQILGYPVYAEPNLQSLGAASRRIGVFGNPEGFFVRQVGAVRVERSDDYAFDTDLVSFRFIVRVDSRIVDDTAFKTLRTGSAG